MLKKGEFRAQGGLAFVFSIRLRCSLLGWFYLLPFQMMRAGFQKISFCLLWEGFESTPFCSTRSSPWSCRFTGRYKSRSQDKKLLEHVHIVSRAPEVLHVPHRKKIYFHKSSVFVYTLRHAPLHYTHGHNQKAESRKFCCAKSSIVLLMRV